MNNWFLFPLSKLETGISNFSFYSRNPRSEFHISLSTLEIRDQNLVFLFLLSKFETRISNFSFYSRIYFFDSRQCLLGRSVCTIPSHGAVARSVAAEAHTAFPACNLRLTSNLPSFINLTVNLSRRRRSTTRHLSYFLQHPPSTASLAVYIRSVLKLFISPHERKSYLAP